MFRFSIRDVLWLTVVVGLAMSRNDEKPWQIVESLPQLQ
jgi:hypothetical protein